MWNPLRGEAVVSPASPERPRLELSGPRLVRALEDLVAACEREGGVERYVGALALKCALFEDLFGKGQVSQLDETAFYDACAFVAPARRRVGPWLERHGFPPMRAALIALLDGWRDPTTADARLAAFCGRFPDDGGHRWVRDLGAEVLHYTLPRHYPLAARWVWDRQANAGVLREIWHAPDLDAIRLEVADDFATFVTLRAELEGFLRDNGVFRDLPLMVDLLCAHIYGAYVRTQGAAYLRADFSNPEDHMLYTCRMLGLDGVDSKTGRTRLKLGDGRRHALVATRLAH